jgi:hypothetical protein
MAQYTSSDTTEGGVVVNAILDSVSNTITYTVTTPKGLSASVTLPSYKDPIQGVATLNDIRNQLAAQNGGTITGLGLTGFGSRLSATWGDVNQQAKKAQATATATDTPVPQESQPIPTNNAANPAVPAAEQPASVQNTAPEAQTTGQTASVPNPIAQIQVTPLTDPVQTPIPENTTPAPIQQYSNRPEPTVAEATPVAQKTVETVPDTQPQVTQQVPDPQKSIAINTAGLPVVAEDGTVSNKTNINPETGQLYTPIPANEISQDPSAKGSSRGLQTATKRARAQATSQDASYLSRLPDWRVKLQLAEGATYLYKSPTDAGILQPLQETEGVVFPYTPSIQVQYGAHYDPTELTHSNYKVFQYKNSSVDNISITADFTAQDTYEARYLLAVIHFFRSVTKMFYGNDLNPRNGTPPPLCYLTGFGEFNFNQHPLAITNFTYTLPNDVDYVRANTEANSPPGVNQSAANSPNNTGNPTTERTTSSGIQPGGKSLGPKFNIDPSKYQTGAKDPTYVPTKMQIQLTAVPIMSRNVISTKFSLKDYASGKLLQGSKQPGVKGVW